MAHDARTSGPYYMMLAASQYLQNGLEVLLIPEVCSTSLFYFAAMMHPELAAVMVGASHNPAVDTGQKILGPGVRPIAAHIGPEGGLDRIREIYVSNTSSCAPDFPYSRYSREDAAVLIKEAAVSARPRVTAFSGPSSPMEEYIAYSMGLAGVPPGSLKGVSILHDYLNGAAGREMQIAFERAGADLCPLHAEPNGKFPLGDPNPVKPDVIREGLETLTSGKFVFGTFFDGDGDRIDFYRGDGTYLSSSFVYAAILPEIRKRFPGSDMRVYADLKSNPLAIMEMARCGVSVDVIRNGHSQIKNAMYENATMFGTVEESAHFYEAFTYGGAARARRYCTENTLYIALLVARVWKEHPERFAALFDLQARTAREREWGYKFPSDEARALALDAVRQHFERKGTQAISRMPNGYDLEATMMRRGIPFAIEAGAKFAPDWLQVCQRVSQSEDGLARWETVAATPEIAAQAKCEVATIVRRFGASEEYKG